MVRSYAPCALLCGVLRPHRVLDAFDMALICHILYWYLITNYGNPFSLQNPVW